MKNCCNCYYYDKCDHEKRCEFYDPIYSKNSQKKAEYGQLLKKRVRAELEIIEEMED